MQTQQHHIYQQAGGQSLENGNDTGLASDLLQRGQAELIADGEGNKAQRHIRDQTHFFHKFKGVEAQSGDAHTAQQQGTYQHTCDQITGNVRQIEFHEQSGQKQTRKHCHTNGKQDFHN